MHTDSGTDHSLSAPHERALAHAIGLVRADGSAYPDGRLPWAAAHSDTPELPQAWFTPCHFQVGMEQVTLLPGDQLGLTDEHARPLFDALAPYCAEDGITLRYESATRWHASGEVLRGIACASLDRVGGRSVEAWMTDSTANPAGGQLLKRLQSEAQMLFYTHPAHDAARSAAPAPASTASGSAARAPSTTRLTLRAAPAMPDALRSAALQADWARWKDAWAALDNSDIQDLLDRARRGEPVTLTLCGERSRSASPTPARRRGARWPPHPTLAGQRPGLEDPGNPMKIITRDVPPRAAWALEQGGLHPLLARLFAARGITSTDELDDALARLIPPSQMLGAQDAARALADAMAANQAHLHRGRLRLRRRHRLRGRPARPAPAGRAHGLRPREATSCPTA